jgi:cyclic beta-1,2-glucan synthetase
LRTIRRGAAGLLALILYVGAAAADDPPVRLTDAAESGAFNVGPATGSATKEPDGTLKFDYAIPPGAAAGVWAKGFPPDRLAPDGADVVRLSARVADDVQAKQLAADVEVKGTDGVQRIPLRLSTDGVAHEVPLTWPTIGRVKEIAVVFNRVGSGEPARGSVVLDVQFEKLPWLRKASARPEARIAGVILAGLLMAGVWAAVRGVGGRPAGPRTTGLRRDFALGIGAVGVAGLAVAVYHLGSKSPLGVGWAAVGVAAAGAVLAAVLAYDLAGKRLTPVELFLSATGVGLPAASTSSLALFQAPGQWADVLLLSATAAAGVALFFHAANLTRLAVAGRPLGPAMAGLILLTPYVLGALLLLRSDTLLRTLGTDLGVDDPALGAFLGRVAVLFLVAAAVAHGLSLAVAHKPLRSGTAHLTLLAVAAAAVAAPWVAAIGSGKEVASWALPVRLAAALVYTMLSQAGLWGAVYLVTGLVSDALNGRAPTAKSVRDHPVEGMRKGAVYSGVFMAVLSVPELLWQVPAVRAFAEASPVVAATLAGALAFPLVKTVIETFDGSTAFFRRTAESYRNPILYARGAVVGLGVGIGLAVHITGYESPTRSLFGFAVGVAAFAGVNLARDLLYAQRNVGWVQSGRVYLVNALLGGAIGAAIGFYLDAVQVGSILDKANRYLSAGAKPEPFDVYPLLSKWGFIHLGEVTGGSGLLFAEALAGVISWSIPAWLFVLNRTVMAAFFRKELAPVSNLFTTGGLVELSQSMIGVLRWGLWMSPIINSFLHPTGTPTWYNQDGAVRTAVATVQDIVLPRSEFEAWSLWLFTALLAYDPVRILIWLDHFGLRVATLVNLSFLGMDKLDEKLARFLSPHATFRCVPEAVKRFTTWAPLLLPFYIPRNENWDTAWNDSQKIQQGHTHDLWAAVTDLSVGEQVLLVAAAVAAATAAFAVGRGLRGWLGWDKRPDVTLLSNAYEVTVTPDGGVYSRVPNRNYDVSRRSYDTLDPAGRALFVVDGDQSWPVVGNFGGSPTVVRGDSLLAIFHLSGDLGAEVKIALAGDDPAEVWTVTVANLGDAPRTVKLVPYLEWVLNRPDADRGHTQYNRLFAEVEYVAGLNAVVARDKHSKATGVLAADVVPEGFLSARVDFIGRARSVWNPRALETLAFSPAADTDGHPTFDPIGSLLLPLTVPAKGSATVRLLIGMVADKKAAVKLVAKHLKVPGAAAVSPTRWRKQEHSIGHGEVPPGTSQPYSDFSADGRTLLVHTPYTPRPYDHALSNGLGHLVTVTNRGLHTTASVNAQQNRLTPDWADTVTREVPGEAIYLFDPDRGEWYSPTYHPINDSAAEYRTEFGVDGTATFHMTRGDLATELTVFVPPDEPCGVYHLTVRNNSATNRRIRVAPYFQMVLSGQPESAGPLTVRHDPAADALYFENPRNPYRAGPAFVSVFPKADRTETNRGRFFGAGVIAAPEFLANPAPEPIRPDDRPVAAFLVTLEVPAGGSAEVVVVLGQADDRRRAEAVVQKFRSADTARASLKETRNWWLRLMDAVRVKSADPVFDRYLDWLKYQALAERIWARRGFYQASGAFGFRDQLQDSVNLLWMDPGLARRQLLLHAAQQFREGDVVHWFHRLQDGRTGFVGRTHASDNLLWLPWGVAEYLAATGDDTVLDEQAAYLDADKPFEPLPAGKGGMGFDPLRSARTDTLYRHCLRAIDLVLDKRMGSHGLPLMGTGDWNDGLDEIGSEGRGESVWLGFFLYYTLDRLTAVIGRKDGPAREEYYRGRLKALGAAVETTWRGDRYLRAFHDDGTEIGVAGSGVWEIDALTAGWAVMAGINPERGRTVFDTAVKVLERETTILLGWPALREDTHPYLGRSSGYPEGVRENGMYCHGVQWLIGAARVLATQRQAAGDAAGAAQYRETADRLWRKISPLPHAVTGEIETYGGQPNKQAADMVTSFDPGRMIWNGYTGAAGWMFRQALEGVLGLRLVGGKVVAPAAPGAVQSVGAGRVTRDVGGSPLPAEVARPGSETVSFG